MYFVPWWLLLVCLPVAGLAAFLALRGPETSRRTLYVLTVVLSPVLLLGAAVIAVVVSTVISAAFEPAPQSPTQPTRMELTSPEPNNPTTFEETVPETTGPSASPGSSPSASPDASPSASPASGG